MSDVSQPRMARATLLPVGILVAALFALLAFAPFASAAPDPVASGTTTITLNNGFSKALKKSGVKLLKVSPATVKGKTVTLPVSGGSMDPLTGQGILTHSGGIKFKLGKKSVTLTNLELDTTSGSLAAKAGKKKLKVASLKGFSFARNGFGVDVTAKKLKLTGKAAQTLNKALAQPTKKKAGKKGKASASKTKTRAIFKAGQNLGGAFSTSQPSTVTIVPGGNATLTTSLPTVTKLTKVGVEIETVAPTAVAAAGPPPAYAFPIAGESISPTATAGIVKTIGGLKLAQDLEKLGATGAGTTTMTLGNIWVDLGTKAATVEVTVENPKVPKANLGNLGRSSIADIVLAGVTADPATRTISVQDASATLQAVTAEVLNSVFVTPIEEATKAPQEKFAPGDPLGTFSFVAQTQ